MMWYTIYDIHIYVRKKYRIYYYDISYARPGAGIEEAGRSRKKQEEAEVSVMHDTGSDWGWEHSPFMFIKTIIPVSISFIKITYTLGRPPSGPCMGITIYPTMYIRDIKKDREGARLDCLVYTYIFATRSYYFMFLI